jgi:hypothetical protein
VGPGMRRGLRRSSINDLWQSVAWNYWWQLWAGLKSDSLRWSNRVFMHGRQKKAIDKQIQRRKSF